MKLKVTTILSMIFQPDYRGYYRTEMVKAFLQFSTFCYSRLAAFFPRLNEAGNSIKVLNAITAVAKELNANIFLRQCPDYRRME